MIQHSGRPGQFLAILLRCPQPAARGQHIAQVIGQAFIDPQQIVLHRLFVIRSGQVSRPPIFAIPRMHVFMWQQTGMKGSDFRIDQRPFFGAAVIRFVMLQAKMSNVITQTENEVVVAVMGSPE